MRLQGKVVEDVSIDNNTSKYKIENDEGIFVVNAFGKEAVKDYLFIRAGQLVTIEGEISGKKICKNKAKIKIDSEKGG